MKENHTCITIDWAKCILVWYTDKVRPFPASYKHRTGSAIAKGETQSMTVFLPCCVYSHALGCGEVDKFLCSAHKEHHKAAFWIDHSCYYLNHLPEKCSLPQASCILHGETGTPGRRAEVRLNVTSAPFKTYFCSTRGWDLVWYCDEGPWYLSNLQHYYYLSTESTLRLRSPHLMQERGLLFRDWQ